MMQSCMTCDGYVCQFEWQDRGDELMHEAGCQEYTMIAAAQAMQWETFEPIDFDEDAEERREEEQSRREREAETAE